MRYICVFLFCLVIAQSSPVVYPQSAKPNQNSAQATRGSISGRVFAITKSGDIKPARFAKVYLISGAVNKSHDSAVTAYIHRQGELATDRIAKLQQKLDSGDAASLPTEAVNCDTDLLNVTESVEAAMKWGEENRRYSAVQSSQTDENGDFHISGIRLDPSTGNSVQAVNPATGTKSVAWEWLYTVVVLGRAGANDAYWEANVQFNEVNGHMYWRVEAEDLSRGQDASIKLPSPKTACLRLGD
jgi:hypothetical protein